MSRTASETASRKRAVGAVARCTIIAWLCLASSLFAGTITGSQPLVEMNATRLTFLQTQKTNNTIYWQRMKTDCDTKINATTLAGGGSPSTLKGKTVTCAALISLVDDTLTHSGGTWNGFKYARIAWIINNDQVPSATCVNAADAARAMCAGIAIGYSWAYHDQTGSATEVANVLSQITNQCATAIPSSNPNVDAGDIFQGVSSCVASFPDNPAAQAGYDVNRTALTTYFTNKMSGAGGYLAGGSNGEGLEYGPQTIWLIMRTIDTVEQATGENMATLWNPNWPNDMVDALYFWTTPNGRGQTFSYSAAGQTFSATASTYYELMPYGDNQDAQNNTSKVRLTPYTKIIRAGAGFLTRWFRDHSDTTRAAYMQYWMNTFFPYWSNTTSGDLENGSLSPWTVDFLTQDPAQTATNYNDTRAACYQVTGMKQWLCKSDLTSDAMHLMFSGDGGHVGHSHSDPGSIEVYVNKAWALAEIPGYSLNWNSTVRHNTILPNGHGAMYDGATGWPGGGSGVQPSTTPGTMVAADHSAYSAATDNMTEAYSFNTAAGPRDVDATNGVVRSVLFPYSGGTFAVLDRVKLATGISGPSPQIWNCPPVRPIDRNFTFNATNFSDWVGQPVPQNGHLYKLTTAGKTAVTQPTFNTGSGSTTTDGTAVWTEVAAPCTVSSNAFQINFIAGSATNPVVFQQNATYGTVLPSATAVLTLRDNNNSYVTAVRDVSNPSPLRFQMERFYSGGIATGTVKTLSGGATGNCVDLNAAWTITVPNQTSTDGRYAYFTIPYDATGKNLNGCIGDPIITNTTVGTVNGYHITAEKNAYSNTACYLTILQPGPSSTSKTTVTELTSGGGLCAAAEVGSNVYAGFATAGGSTCVSSYSGFSSTLPRTHFLGGFPASSTCWYKVTGGAVDILDSNGGGYTSASTDAAGSFSFTTSGGATTLTSFTVSCPTSPITAGVAQNCTATAKDQDGNTMTSYTGSPTCTTGDPQAVIGSCANFVSGAKTISLNLKTASQAAWFLTVTDGSATGNSSNIIVNAAAAAACTLAGIETPRTAGIVSHSAVATFRDAFSNAAIPSGNNSWTSSDGSATLPATATCAQTSCSYDVTFATAGTQSVTVTNAGGSFNCSQTGIIVNAAGGVNYFKGKKP